MAVYHEYWYADSHIHTYGSKLREKMKLEIEKYANSPKSLKDWPYKYMNEIKRIVELHGSSKLVVLIKKWKSDPNNVMDFIDRLI